MPGLRLFPHEIILFSQDHGKFDILTMFSQAKPMQVRERRANTTASRLNGRTVMCVVALTLAEARPLREQMEQRRIIHANETPVAVKQELGQHGRL